MSKPKNIQKFLNELSSGFATVVDNGDYKLITASNDSGEWESFLSGFKVLFNYSLYRMLEDGLSEKEADDVCMLRLFFDRLEKHLS